MRRSLRLVARLLRWFVYAVFLTLVLVVLVLVVLQTGWAKNQLRALIVRQANQYLTATLSIGRLQGSLVRGIQLGDVTLARNGRTLIHIDDVSVSYNIRELFEQGTSIRQIRIARPQVLVEKEADGRWNLGALIRRSTRVSQRTGPGRPIHIRSIEVSDGKVIVKEPVSFGAAHIPTEYEDLDLNFSLDYQPVAWKASFAHASFKGKAPDLRINQMTGSMSNNADGWLFDRLLVETPRSRFILDGRVDRRTPPVRLPLRVDADQFVFQEWAGVLNGLKNIAIRSEFSVQLDGPLAALQTDLTLRSNGGNVKGGFVLDTTAPGWQARGAVDVERLNLAAWLNREDRPSDITGHVTFGLTDIGLRAGGKFPAGTYAFDGPHAGYLDYAADNLKARGVLTPTEARIASATGRAYGADLTVTAGSIGIDDPNTFAFKGTARGVDLRLLPKQVPVPHVESLLTFDYDVTGQFSSGGFIKGTARFAESTFLDAQVGADTVGAIDTSVTPFQYSGEGDLSRINLHRFGTGLDVAWLQDPRYAGTVTGHFRVAGAGSDINTMRLEGGGRVPRADLFGGQLTDADVTIAIQNGSLSASYDGRLSSVNPALALDDKRYDASLTGSGKATITVRDLLLRSPQLADYEITTQAMFESSRVRDIALQTAALNATLHDGTLTIDQFHGVGPLIDLQATGRVEFDRTRSSQIDYNIVRGDLALVRDFIGRDISGELVTKGQMTGPLDRVRLQGAGTLWRVDAAGLKALSAELTYDATIPTDAPENASVTVDGHISSIETFGQTISEATGKASYDAGRIVTDLKLQRQDLEGTVAGTFQLHREARTIDVLDVSLGIQRSMWKLAPDVRNAQLRWNDRGIILSSLAFVDQASGSQRITFDGPWYPDGGGNLHVVAERISIDALTAESGGPAQ